MSSFRVRFNGFVELELGSESEFTTALAELELAQINSVIALALMPKRSASSALSGLTILYTCAHFGSASAAAIAPSPFTSGNLVDMPCSSSVRCRLGNAARVSVPMPAYAPSWRPRSC